VKRKVLKGRMEVLDETCSWFKGRERSDKEGYYAHIDDRVCGVKRIRGRKKVRVPSEKRGSDRVSIHPIGGEIGLVK